MCLPALCWAATVYRWVDADGVVHFSDQPQPGAVKIQIREPQSYTPGPTPATSKVAPNVKPQTEPHDYQNCEVSVPGAGGDQSLMNSDSVTVTVQMQPALRQGDQLTVQLDGTNLTPLNGTRYEISPIDRGAHVASAVVRSASGDVLCQSPAVNFYVHQPSVLGPKPH
ncbi:MAG TPA: DUF4124 domain-containing protein [Steroidobacteraceae bacterium]|nr:DUF4124 domain-containing protein [Steroidobacteraceae bacterium]